MERELHALADKAGTIRDCLVLGTTNEFDRARLLRDMGQLCMELRTQAHRAAELSTLILTLGEDGPTAPIGGGRRA